MRFVFICDCKYTTKNTTSSTHSLATGNLVNARTKPDNLKSKCLTLHYVKIIVIHLIYVQNMAILQISSFSYMFFAFSNFWIYFIVVFGINIYECIQVCGENWRKERNNNGEEEILLVIGSDIGQYLSRVKTTQSRLW